jgi:hypothetical protein
MTGDRDDWTRMPDGTWTRFPEDWKPKASNLAAAAALLREAGWRVEEPKCETCKGLGDIEDSL